MKSAFTNKPFILVTILYSLSNLCVQFVQNNLILFTKYVVNAEPLFQYFLLTVMTSAVISLFIWDFLSRRWGKKNVYIIGVTFWIGVEIYLFFVRAEEIVLMFILCGFAGTGVGVAYLIPWSMLPDVIELDELKTGIRREGVFYSFFVLFQKIGLSLGLAISNYVLALTGYITPAPGEYVDQPPEVLFALRILIGPAPALMLAFSLIAAYYYPITRSKHDQIRRELLDKTDNTEKTVLISE